MVTIDRNTPTSTVARGADNTHTRVWQNDTSLTITLTLGQSSNSNDILTYLYEKDRASKDNTWLFTILVKDGSGRSLYHALQAYIAVVPNSSFGNTFQNREWQIHAINSESFIGGNGQFDPSDLDAVLSLDGNPDDRWIPS